MPVHQSGEAGHQAEEWPGRDGCGFFTQRQELQESITIIELVPAACVLIWYSLD